MSLVLGVVGLPSVGRSILFNALMRNDVLAANYPFTTIEPSVGVVELPDLRLNRLAEIYKSKRIVPATVSFMDIAGIIKDASEGEGLGNKLLVNIREADAIYQIVRVFNDDDVVHVDGKADSASDTGATETEPILADIQTIEKALPRLKKEARKDKDKIGEVETVKQALAVLEKGCTPFAASDDVKLPALRESHLLTVKSFLYVLNADEEVLADEDHRADLAIVVEPADRALFDAKAESDLLELDEESRNELLVEIGQIESGLHSFARAGFRTLGLQTYLIVGEQEAHARTIRRDATAPEAVGVTHTDSERGFIKAETVSFNDLVEVDSTAEAEAKGKARQEGEDYIMHDDDVVGFEFNV